MLDNRLGFRSAIVAGVLALVAAACGAQEEVTIDEAPERLSIVAVTSILGSIVEDLVGDAADVTVLIGPGVDPHTYQSSARDGQVLRDADLVVANGPLDDVPLEESLFDLLSTVRDEGVAVFDFVANIDALAFAGHGEHGHDDHDDHGHDHDHDKDDHDKDDHGHDHDHDKDDHDKDDHDKDDHGHDHDHDKDDHDKDDHDKDDHDKDDHGHDDEDDHGHGDLDPHFWWDLERVADGVEQLALAIAQIDADRTAEFWLERATETAQIYRDLDAEIIATVAVLSEDQRVIVTNHDSFGYFADRYGFTIRATVVPGSSTDAQTNPRAFAQLIDLLIDEDIRVIFAENTDSTRLAEQLATQATGQGLDNVTVVRLYTDALGPQGSGAETYIGMVQTTVGLIVDALG
jgi:ABC-type Zn uptake system ZnuABC Zn-binding protein ZnuA